VLDEATASIEFLRRHYPVFIDNLAAYPKITAKLEQRRLFNIEEEGGRPLFVLKHRLMDMQSDHVLIAERQYYISHSLDALQVMILFLPTERGTLMAMLNQTYTGHVAPAVGGRIAHRVGHAKVREKIEPIFAAMQKQYPLRPK